MSLVHFIACTGSGETRPFEDGYACFHDHIPLLHILPESVEMYSTLSASRAINWLYHSGIIGFCGKIVELDILDFKPGRRCYFMDLGILIYKKSLAGATNHCSGQF